MILRIQTILALDNIFDYKEFKAKCEADNASVLPIGEFAQKVGILKVAIVKYPGLAPLEAYLKFIEDMNRSSAIEEKRSKDVPFSTGCGSCGGGKKEAGGQLR